MIQDGDHLGEAAKWAANLNSTAGQTEYSHVISRSRVTDPSAAASGNAASAATGDANSFDPPRQIWLGHGNEC